MSSTGHESTQAAREPPGQTDGGGVVAGLGSVDGAEVVDSEGSTGAEVVGSKGIVVVGREGGVVGSCGGSVVVPLWILE